MGDKLWFPWGQDFNASDVKCHDNVCCGMHPDVHSVHAHKYILYFRVFLPFCPSQRCLLMTSSCIAAEIHGLGSTATTG